MNFGQQILRTAASVPFAIATSTARTTSTPTVSYISPTIGVQLDNEVRDARRGVTQIRKLGRIHSPSELKLEANSGPRLHPKLAYLNRTMSEYSLLGANWAGDGSTAPSDSALSDMETFVERLPKGLPIPAPSISFDGEPGLYWDETAYFMDVAFHGDGVFSAFVRAKGSTQDEFREGISVQSDEWQDTLLTMSKRFEA